MLSLVLSCGTTPQPVNTEVPASEPSVPTVVVVPEAPPKVEVFDPNSVSEEDFAAAKADIQSYINDLNRIIRARDYEAWRTHLADSYFETISSPEFLEEKTEELYRRDQSVATTLGRDPRMVEKKILRTARDYFSNVVVPSRSNDRVDDISFISETRVRVYTVDTREQRLVLYDLVSTDKEDKWEIIN